MIDPDFLDELARFDARLNRRLAGTLTGEHESHVVGEGRTFSDYRRYVPGDDTRLVDWKVYGRTDQLYVKQFETERDLTMHLLVDATGSMDFGEGEADKFEYAAKLAIGFAYLAVAENNDFAVALLTDESTRLDGGRSTRGEVLALIDRCNEVDPEGEGDLRAALEAYAGTIRSRSLVVVCSDFLEEPAVLERGLAPLSRHDLTLAHVLAPEEIEPPTYGDTIFEGIERALARRTYFGTRLRRAYQQRLDAHIEAVAARAQGLGARHVRVDTGAEFFSSFLDVWPE